MIFWGQPRSQEKSGHPAEVDAGIFCITGRPPATAVAELYLNANDGDRVHQPLKLGSVGNQDSQG